MNIRILLYGLVLAGLILLMKWIQWHFLLVENAVDIYIGFIALLFLSLGIWIANQMIRPKTIVVVQKKPDADANDFLVTWGS